MKKLKWHDVAVAHKILEQPIIGEMRDIVIQLGYPYFCWNDRIYKTETMDDTGMTMKDVE